MTDDPELTDRQKRALKEMAADYVLFDQVLGDQPTMLRLALEAQVKKLMLYLQQDFLMVQYINRGLYYHNVVVIVGKILGENKVHPETLFNRRMLHERYGIVDTPTFRMVEKLLDQNCDVVLFDKDDHLAALFDIAKSDLPGSDMFRATIEALELTPEQLQCARDTLNNNLLGEPPNLTITPGNYKYEYPYAPEPAKSEVEHKPKKQHGPQSRRQWWNR